MDWERERLEPARLEITDGLITGILPDSGAPQRYIIPGFTDAHVHIESSMLPPSLFAPLALAQGTVATVSDPHEIANVLGSEGVRWMAADAKGLPVHIHLGAPSCVPATVFETAGDEVSTAAIAGLLEDKTCGYLAEMMNWPGIIFRDREVMARVELAHSLGVPVDGHAPGLRGSQARDYFAAGIQTDHECFSLEEAREKAALGVKILIREGSAARNFDALIPILGEYPGQVMFCSDDKHPDDLLMGHINRLAARAVARGFDVFTVLRAACVNPVRHYGLPIGLLRTGDPADFLVVDDLESFQVQEVWRRGEKVFDRSAPPGPAAFSGATPNRFFAHYPALDEYLPPGSGTEKSRARVIRAVEGELITRAFEAELEVRQGRIQADSSRDILHLSVVNRYQPEKPSHGFIQGFGLREAAIASSVAHDSHNIVVVGSDPVWMKEAVDAVMRCGGGIALASEQGTAVLPLPIAGLMSDQPGEWVARQYESLTQKAREAGATPRAPFMLLSFMALLVIPDLKLSDRGLFDGQAFAFTGLEV